MLKTSVGQVRLRCASAFADKPPALLPLAEARPHFSEGDQEENWQQVKAENPNHDLQRGRPIDLENLAEQSAPGADHDGKDEKHSAPEREPKDWTEGRKQPG